MDTQTMQDANQAYALIGPIFKGWVAIGNLFSQ
jgi:hypothetical protein